MIDKAYKPSFIELIHKMFFQANTILLIQVFSLILKRFKSDSKLKPHFAWNLNIAKRNLEIYLLIVHKNIMLHANYNDLRQTYKTNFFTVHLG